MFFVRSSLVLMLMLTLAATALPQQREGKSRPSKTKLSPEAEELRLSATSLLHSLAQSANEIDDIAERVRILAEIGDAFWPIDEEHARAVLIRSFKEIDKLSAGHASEAEQIASQKRAMRRVVLARIARHEPALASQLVHDLPSEIPSANEKAMQRQGVSTPNADALLGVAESLLSSDPKQAATVAGHSLQDGLSQRFRWFLSRLRTRDPAASDALVQAAIREASLQHPGRLFDVLILWDYAYQPAQFHFNGIVWRKENNALPQDTPPALKRAILAFAVNAIVENLQQLPAGADSTPDRNLAQMQLETLHAVIQQVLPSMQVDWPKGISDLQQALVRVEQELKTAGLSPPAPPPVSDADSNVSEIDKLTEKAGAAAQGDTRDGLYLEIAFKYLELKQFDNGKAVAGKIDDPERRAMILEPLNFGLIADLVAKGKLQDALSIASQIKTPELRIGSLARIGRAFIEAGDSQSGLQTLSAAQSIASKSEPTMEVAASALRVAAAFSKTDPIRVSELVTLAIQITNKLKPDETPWVLLAPAGTDDALGLSWKRAEGGGLQWVKATYPRNGGLTNLLLNLDFNQAVSLAKTVDKKSLSLAAQAAVCRGAIESTNNKANSAKSN